MSLSRRAAVLMMLLGVTFGAAEAFAKGPRILLQAALRPVAGAPPASSGKAKFDQSASRTNFSVEAEKLIGLNGKVATIFVNDAPVGSRTVALGRISLELTTQRGGTVPAVAVGSKVTVFVGATLVLSGTF